MTDDTNRFPQPPSQWSGQQPDGTQAWGTPTYQHDPHHTEWTYDRGPAYGAAPYAAPDPRAYVAPPAPPQGSGTRRRSAFVAAAAAIVAAAATAFGFVVAGSPSSTVSGSGSLFPSVQGGSGNSGSGSSGSSGSSGGGLGSGGTTGGLGGGLGSGGIGGSGTGSGSGTTSASVATTKEQQGVVTIVSVLKYQNAESAGTGMILSSNGEILTNNHVINGATSITVTVKSTGKSYSADVVGTDATDDVAVIQLRNASGLTKAKIGDSGSVATGDSIVGVGNAGGTGTLRASSGKVTGLDKTITASDGEGSSSERLHGLIEVNAPIISGDSGGPMYDSAGEIIGMNTAASEGQSATTDAYAIPTNAAVAIADQIESGVTSSTIVQGVPGFLGVGVADATPGTGSGTAGGSTSGGAPISSVLQGGPADRAGITAGSVITKVGGKTITSGTQLRAVMDGVKPGSTVKVTWTGADGSTHSAKITPIEGPAA